MVRRRAKRAGIDVVRVRARCPRSGFVTEAARQGRGGAGHHGADDAPRRRSAATPPPAGRVGGQTHREVVIGHDKIRRLSPGRTVGKGPLAVVAGDFDGDRKMDLAVANTGSSELSVLLNQGGGTFSRGVDYDDVQPPFHVTSADIDNDGDMDLITANQPTQSVSIFKNEGDGTFVLGKTLDVGQPASAVISWDVNGDGLKDLAVMSTPANTLSIIVNSGDGTFQNLRRISVGRDPRTVRLGDMNGDGTLDLVTFDHSSPSITVVLNDAFLESFLARICTQSDFYLVSVSSSAGNTVERLTKYVIPVDREDPALLTPVFQNVHRFPLHQEFLSKVFPERFPALTPFTIPLALF